MTTGEKIAVQRRKAGSSQEALAAQLGLSRQAVSRWETNESLPDTERIIQLSRIFGVSTDYLLLENQRESKDASPKAAPPPAESVSSGASPLPEPPAIRLFRLGGIYLTGGGAALSLVSLVLSVLLTVAIGDESLGFVLLHSRPGSGLMVGILLMLIGILLLGVGFLLRRQSD